MKSLFNLLWTYFEDTVEDRNRIFFLNVSNWAPISQCFNEGFNCLGLTAKKFQFIIYFKLSTIIIK